MRKTTKQEVGKEEKKKEQVGKNEGGPVDCAYAKSRRSRGES
jgi:hypothetical protein